MNQTLKYFCIKHSSLCGPGQIPNSLCLSCLICKEGIFLHFLLFQLRSYDSKSVQVPAWESSVTRCRAWTMCHQDSWMSWPSVLSLGYPLLWHCGIRIRWAIPICRISTGWIRDWLLQNQDDPSFEIPFKLFEAISIATFFLEFQKTSLCIKSWMFSFVIFLHFLCVWL